jgi:signal transduction histidine kinase
VLAAIAIGVLPLILLAAANLARQVEEGERRVREDRIALARAAALTVSGFLDTSFATLETLAVTPTVADPTVRPQLSDLLGRARPPDSPLELIGLFRADGWNVALAGSDQPPFTLNVLDREYVQRARSRDARVVSPATIPRTTGVLTVDEVIPVDFTTGDRGVVLGSLALTKLGQQLQALPGIDSGVKIVIVDSDGQVVLHPDQRVVQSITSLRARPEVDAALRGETDSVRGPSSDDPDALTAYAPVPDYSWGVLVEQPADNAFALVRRDLALAVGVLVLIVALVGVIGWFLGARLGEAYSQVNEARLRAEDAQRRLAFLADASHILASPLEDQTTLQRVARLAVPALGDGCTIKVVDSEGVRGTSSSTNGVNSERLNSLAESLAAEAAVDGRPVVRQATIDGHQMSGLGLPLLAGGNTVGTIVCWRSNGAPYTRSDVELGEALAERVALAVENVRQYQAAQAAVRARDDFLAVAAHELKTPVTSLRGYAQLALRWIKTDRVSVAPDFARALQVIELQSEKLTRLIGQLLDVSRLETGRLKISRDLVDLVPLVRGLIDRTRMSADHHTFDLDAPEHAPARVDLLRIEQVITNLLDNAVKFSPHGGVVRVELSNTLEGNVRLAVQDQGIGIDADKQSHIFERFYQAHEERLRSGFAGLGLGLYVSRDIVEQHGGTIEVESPPEGGTRFTVTLPSGVDVELSGHGDAAVPVVR